MASPSPRRASRPATPRLCPNADRGAPAARVTVGCRMGWRSWNCYHGNVNQSSIEATIDAIADTSRGTSLLALGFSDVGVDDGWQACGTGRALDNHTSFHAADGTPLVNFTKFADVKAMVAYGHKNKGMVSTQRNPHQKLEDQPSERLRVV